MIPKKTLLVLSALLVLAGARALSGCGGDDCTRAADHIAECMPDMSSSSSSSSSSGMMLACQGAIECQSQCINNFTCPEINGMTPAFVACLRPCQGK